MVLAPGTGVTLAHGRPRRESVSVGLATGGEALYLLSAWRPTAPARAPTTCISTSSAGKAAPVRPPGLASLDLPSLADNAYYVGHTAAGNDLAANWVRYDGAPVAGTTTPGDPNPGQDLSSLRSDSCRSAHHVD